jgi:phosphatidylglycerophosphate synthase
VPVTVGIFVTQMEPPDLKTSQFRAVFWLWFRWTGSPDLDPMSKFEVVGGEIGELENLAERKYDGGINYVVARVRATITQDLDITRFPLDSYELKIAIEETSEAISGVQYVADGANSSIEPLVRLPGWVMKPAIVGTSTAQYDTNFGDVLDEDSDKYARFTMTIPIARPGISYPLKLFWSVYLSVFVALLALQIKPIDLDPRFGLGIGAVFAVMAAAVVISSILPDGNQVTLADKVVIYAIGFIVGSIIESIVSLRLFQSGREAASLWLDRWGFLAILAAYIGINTWILMP